MTSQPASPTAIGNAPSSLSSAIRKYCVHVHEYLVSVPSFVSSEDSGNSAGASSSRAAADAFVRRGKAVATLQEYRQSLTEMLKGLGVEALDNYTYHGNSGSGADFAVSADAGTTPVVKQASTNAPSVATFSVPSLISRIDAMLPTVAFGAWCAASTTSSSESSKSAATSEGSSSSSLSVLFSSDVRSKVLKSIILDHSVIGHLSTMTANNNAKVNVSTATATATAEMQLLARLPALVKAAKRERVSDDESENKKRTVSVTETIAKIEEPTTTATDDNGTLPLIRKVTSFVSALTGECVISSTSTDAPSTEMLDESPSKAARRANKSNVSSSCHYDTLLTDYSLPSANHHTAQMTVAKRQEVTSTMIDVIMRGIVTTSSSIIVPVPDQASGAATGAAAANAKTTIVTPPFHQNGLPYRYMQATAQGGGSFATIYTPFKFV